MLSIFLVHLFSKNSSKFSFSLGGITHILNLTGPKLKKL